MSALSDAAGSKQTQGGKSLSSAPALPPQLQPLPLETLLMPAGNIDSTPRNSATELPAACPSTSSQLMSGIITKYIPTLKPAGTEMTLGAGGGDLQSLLCPSSSQWEKLTQETAISTEEFSLGTALSADPSRGLRNISTADLLSERRCLGFLSHVYTSSR